MRDYTAWSLLVDFGCICALLLVGKLARAKVAPVQRLLLPASIIAGALGLALGPNGAGLIPFSAELETYSSILIAVVFAALPLSESFDIRAMAHTARAMWSYSVAMYVLQWSLGLLFALLVLSQFWSLPDGFGLLLAAGWAGGFGTAAAVGTTFEGAGWQAATSLGFTAATVGVVVCIVGGIGLIKWGTRTGQTSVLGTFDQLPAEMRTGLFDPDKEREPIGRATVSSGSLEPLAMHLGLVLVVTVSAYGLTQLSASFFPNVSIPVFAVAFLVGLAVRGLLSATRASAYIDGGTVKAISGTATDFLVAFGIAAIVPSLVAQYVLPLALLLAFGLIYCIVLFRYLTPRMFADRWFERGIFTWGWSTASVATGLALLRIVDPRLESRTLEEFGIAYIGYAPIEILMVTFAPLLVIFGLVWALTLGSLVLGVGVLAAAWIFGWTAVQRRQPTAAQKG